MHIAIESLAQADWSQVWCDWVAFSSEYDDDNPGTPLLYLATGAVVYDAVIDGTRFLFERQVTVSREPGQSWQRDDDANREIGMASLSSPGTRRLVVSRDNTFLLGAEAVEKALLDRLSHLPGAETVLPDIDDGHPERWRALARPA